MPKPDAQQQAIMRLTTQLTEYLFGGLPFDALKLLERYCERLKAPNRKGPTPKKLKVDEEMLEKLAADGSTNTEIAAIAGVSERTLGTRVANSPSLARAYARGASGTRRSLKRALLFNALVCGETRAIEVALTNLCGWNSSKGGGEGHQDLEFFEAQEAERASSARLENLDQHLRTSYRVWAEVYGEMEAIDAESALESTPAAGAVG